MAVVSKPTVASAPPLEIGLRIQLSIMMFLQFAIWGAWFVSFFDYLLKGLNFSGGTSGWIFGTMALGTIFTPMLFGQIADKFLASEKLMALLHLAGAVLLYAMSQVTNSTVMFLTALAYAFVYSPTLALSNSIAFRHIPDGERDFPSIRVIGTIGWIAAGFFIGMVVSDFAPVVDGKKVPIGETAIPLQVAAALSVLMAIYCLLLPATPPTGQGGESFPFLQAVSLLKDTSFAVFFGVSTILAIAMSFYYGLTYSYLKDIGYTDPNSTMTIGQWSELILLPFLPWFLRQIGMKGVLLIGMVAWGIRYAIFSIGGPDTHWLVTPSLALHGICFDFFFAAAFIHVDNTAPKEIRASAQSLFLMLTYGVGMFLGNVLSGELKDVYTQQGITDWQSFWIGPSLGVLVCCVLFALLFRGSFEKKE